LKVAGRKFTFLELEIRSFILTDYFYLITFALAIILCRFPMFFDLDNQSWLLTCYISLAITFFMAGPFVLRLRNVFFSIFWLMFCLLFLIDGYSITFVPLALFLIYHIVRGCFWYFHKKELIPFSVAKGAMFRHRSYFEQRSGTSIDKRYTKILAFLCFLIFMLFFSLDMFFIAHP
jgi:hypothetical protein